MIIKSMTSNKALHALLLGMLTTTCSYAKTINSDVKLLVKQSLSNDDYREIMSKPELAKVTDIIAPFDTTAPSGLVPVKVDDRAYVFHDDLIKTYDLTNQAWLPDTSFPDTVTAFDVDQDGFYVAHTRQLYFYPHSGDARSFIRNTGNDVREIKVINNHLLVSSSSEYLTINKTSYVNADTFGSRTLIGQTALNSRNKVYGRDTGLSPCDIRMVEIDGAGMEVAYTDSPYHGDYACSNRTYPFPDESRIVDGAGIIYHASDLTYAGSLAGAVNDVAFYGDLPIVLRGDTLHAYSNTMLESGQYTLTNDNDFIFVQNDVVTAFQYGAGSAVDVQHVDVSVITPLTPGAPVNPVGLAYNPDSIVTDGDSLYILSRDNLSVFVFSTSTMAYKETIALIEAPMFMSISVENNSLYLAYSSGEVTQIDLETRAESAFANLPQTPCGLSTAGAYVFACDPSGAWASHYTFAPSGVLVSQEDWNYASDVFEWSPVNRKMYHFRNDTSPNDLLSEEIGVDGVIGTQMDSPYHTSSRWASPLCINPDGTNLVVGKGVLYDATTLAESNFLSNEILGCAWAKDRLYTFDDTANTSLQSWEPTMQEVHEKDYDGTPIDLIGLRSGALIIVRDVAGVPQFDIYNDSIFQSTFD